MTIAILPTIPFTCFNPNTGKVLAGGKVFFYEPGTETEKDTYTDAEGSDTNTNPVILDGNGQATVFLDGLYDVVIKTSDEATTIRSLPNVSGNVQAADILEIISDEVSASSASYSVSTVTADTALTGDYANNVVLVDASSGDVTITLPEVTTMVAKGAVQILRIDNSGNTVTIDTAGSTINGESSVTLDFQYQGKGFRTDGSQHYTVSDVGFRLEIDSAPKLGGPLDPNGHYINIAKGANIASAATLTLGSDGNSFDVTGNTNITAISGSQTLVILKFNGVLTLTHHATDLILLDGEDRTTKNKDIAIFEQYSTDAWRCIGFFSYADAAAWEAGTSTEPVFASPANVASAIAAQSPFLKSLLVQDVKASGTAGGGFTSGAWRQRDLTTEQANTIPGSGIAYELDYDGQTADFTIGDTLTGGTSGATATIVKDADGGTTGTLKIINVTGTFQDNETITDESGGSATTNLPSGVVNSGFVYLPAGSYVVRGTVPAVGVQNHQARLYNYTDAAALVIGTSAYCSLGGADFAEAHSMINGQFTLAAGKIITVQHQCSTTKAVNGFGYAGSFGDGEVFTDITFWKVA